MTEIMLTLSVAAFLFNGAAADSGIVLRNARVLDVRTGAIERTTLVIAGEVIVGRGANPSYHPSSTVIDADSFTVLPGLIDTHVHLTLGGRPRDNAASTLKAGFTTVADLGSVAGGGVRLRRLIDGDSVIGPRILAAGSWIGGRGGVCEFGRATIRGEAEARARAIADLEAGAQILKVCVSDWLASAALYPDSVELSAAELAAVIDEGKRAGIPTVAHALSEAAVLLAIRAGVGFLAHTPLVRAAAAEEIARRGVCVSTTVASLERGDSAGVLRASFDRLRRAGVRLVAGTDAGVLPHGSNAEELVAVGRFGLTPLEAIQAATVNAAECLGIPNYGRLVPGERADLILLKGDPLTDISVLRAPAVVVKGGRIIPL